MSGLAKSGRRADIGRLSKHAIPVIAAIRIAWRRLHAPDTTPIGDALPAGVLEEPAVR